MGKLLDAFILFVLTLTTLFVLLWGVLAAVEGAVCFGCILTGLAVFVFRTVLIPLFKGEDGGLV